MTSWRLAALGASGRAAEKLRAALIPLPAREAGAKNSRSLVYGYPGTVRIPAPAPFPHAERELTSLAQTGWIGLPSAAFSYWTPSIYWVPAVEHAPVSVLSDNQMPVPAGDPRGLPGWGGGGLGSARNVREAVVMPGPMMMGQRQVSNPRPSTRFLNPQSRKNRR